MRCMGIHYYLELFSSNKMGAVSHTRTRRSTSNRIRAIGFGCILNSTSVLTADVELEGVRLVRIVSVANDAVVRRHLPLLSVVDIHEELLVA